MVVLLLFFVKIYTSIVSCVYNLKTHTFFSVICGVSLFIRAMCIDYVCSVLTSSIITLLQNISYIVSLPCLLYKSFGYILNETSKPPFNKTLFFQYSLFVIKLFEMK